MSITTYTDIKKQISKEPYFLFVTATDIETEEFFKVLKPIDSEDNIIKISKGNQTYHIGLLGKYNIIHVQCGAMGSTARDASITTVTEALSNWNPLGIVMVGICFGKDPSKQKIGDVLISETITNYESQKKRKDGAIPRSAIPQAGKLLLNRFKNMRTWEFEIDNGTKARRIFGNLLTGEKLIDDIVFKSELFSMFEEAIGGDMEAFGVYSAAESNRIYEWIVVKGICDWADGNKSVNKDINQRLAASAAASLCLAVFNENVFDDINTPQGIPDINDLLNGLKSSATPIIDEKINEEIEIIRKSRFCIEYDTSRAVIMLATRLKEGEYSNGSSEVKGRAFAWCARLMHNDKERATQYLASAKKLSSCIEINIAEAFICNDKKTALTILANIDSPLSHSAALMIIANLEGFRTAVSWLKTSRLAIKNLDSDGKLYLLELLLDMENWDEAFVGIERLNEDDLQRTPLLYHYVAIINLLKAVPPEFRTGLRSQPPLNAEAFPLSSDQTAIDSRKIAYKYFVTSSEITKELDFPNISAIDEEYALWLQLKDPDEHIKGIQNLEAKLHDPDSALRFVNLGQQFNIKFDSEVVEREIERHIALYGGATRDTAIARYSIAFTKDTPKDGADYLTKYIDELSRFFKRSTLILLQIEMYIQAELSERANNLIDNLQKEGLTETEQQQLDILSSKLKGFNHIEILREQFEKSDSLEDLQTLTYELKKSEDWVNLHKYSELLFKRTCSIRDAETLVSALSKLQESKRLLEFLNSNKALLQYSKLLQIAFCWSLYYNGELLKARSELLKLTDDRDNLNYRALTVNIGIALGDWNSLFEFVAYEYKQRDIRNAQELLGTGKLALHIGSPYAKELIYCAAEKGEYDAQIYATAYNLATTAGWEYDLNINEWLKKAIELSDDSGPIHQVSLKELLNIKPDWDRRESETLTSLSKGDIPMFLAAQSLNSSLIHMMLYTAQLNQDENDPRRRVIIPAYSGRYQPQEFNISDRISLDVSAIITLGFLDLLDKTIDTIDTVYISHSTFAWLFSEKQKAAFHQPSRFNYARQIQNLISQGVIEKFIPSPLIDNELASQVGDELALIINEAINTSTQDKTQQIVVRPFPVPRISSLMEEEADLSAYVSVLSSCQAIIEKLSRKGVITSKEKEQAQLYLRLHEKSWPNQPEIEDGAVLYLDGLSISYFYHIGVLEKIKTAGFKLLCSPKTVNEVNQLISYERISDKINVIIEDIRSILNIGIENKKVVIGDRQCFDIERIQDSYMSEHPTIELFPLAGSCKAFIIDDRSLNQNPTLSYEEIQAPIYSTLGILDYLSKKDVIANEQCMDCRTRLRQAGFCLIPIYEEELSFYLNTARVEDGKVIETAELKAIRENILQVRMSNLLQLPKEIYWLDSIFKTMFKVLHNCWVKDQELLTIRARSNWIISQYDIRGWAHRFIDTGRDYIVNNGYGTYVLMLFSPPANATIELKDEYFNWIDETILSSIKEQEPLLFTSMINWYRDFFIKNFKPYLED